MEMEIEKKFVLDVYDNIATHFADTRFCVWTFVKDFLQQQSKLSKGIEIGCGNGKNLCVNKDLQLIGIDNCKPFVDICSSKNLKVYHQNCCNIDFKDNTFDYALSIAVFHHLSSDIRRYNAMKEMIRILKPGGSGVVSVWGVNQINRNNNMKMRTFIPGDNYVPWTRKKDKKIFKRYYYIFNKNMFENFLEQFTHQIKIEKIFNERGNWIVEFIKK